EEQADPPPREDKVSRIRGAEHLRPALVKKPSVDQSGDEAASERSSPSGSPAEEPTTEKRTITFALPPLVKELSPDWSTTPVILEEAGEAAGAPQDSGQESPQHGDRDAL
ncbi:hypothetical protein CRUP_020755, partial [Coryphaenoides rupestris]